MTGMVVAPREALAPRSLDDAYRLAKTTAASGAFGVKSQEDAVVRLLTGVELGLSPMTALRSIHVIEGRPTLSADLCVAVCLQSSVCEYFRPVEITNERAVFVTKRVGSEPFKHAFTMADAQRAGLTGRKMWQTYPSQMLAARCKSALARLIYPDILSGIYDQDEIADDPVQPPVQAQVVKVDDVQTAIDRIASDDDIAGLTAWLQKQPATVSKDQRVRAAYAERRGAIGKHWLEQIMTCPLEDVDATADSALVALKGSPKELLEAIEMACASRKNQREPGEEG